MHAGGKISIRLTYQIIDKRKQNFLWHNSGKAVVCRIWLFFVYIVHTVSSDSNKCALAAVSNRQYRLNESIRTLPWYNFGREIAYRILSSLPGIVHRAIDFQL